MSSSIKVVLLSENLYTVKQHPCPSEKYHLQIRDTVFQIRAKVTFVVSLNEDLDLPLDFHLLLYLPVSPLSWGIIFLQDYCIKKTCLKRWRQPSDSAQSNRKHSEFEVSQRNLSCAPRRITYHWGKFPCSCQVAQLSFITHSGPSLQSG